MNLLDLTILALTYSLIAIYFYYTYKELKKQNSLLKKIREENEIVYMVISNRLKYYDNICKQIYEQYLEDDE